MLDKQPANYIRAEVGSFNITTGDVTMTAVNPDLGNRSARPQLYSLRQYNNTRATVSTGSIDVSTFNTEIFTSTSIMST